MAKNDAQFINTRSEDFAIDATITAKDGTVFTGKLIKNNHTTSYNEIGQKVNVRTTNVCVGCAALIEENFPFKNSGGEVAMIGYVIEFIDAFGTSKKHMVAEQYPDDDLGIIVLILADYE